MKHPYVGVVRAFNCSCTERWNWSCRGRAFAPSGPAQWNACGALLCGTAPISSARFATGEF